MPSVAAPAGTMTQIWRGVGSFSTSSSSEPTSLTSGLGSKPVTSMPAARIRARMLKPIFPRPTIPKCTSDLPSEFGVLFCFFAYLHYNTRNRHRLITKANGHQEVAEVILDLTFE